MAASGRSLDFHIDASDTGRAETASRFDVKHESQAAAGWFGFGNVSHKTSVAYVQTAKQVSSEEINVNVDLSGELDLKFRSDVFPLERFADSGVIGQIQAATPNPAAIPVAAPVAPARTSE